MRRPRSSSSERLGGRLRRALAHPLTRGLDLDDPRTTVARREILRHKRFLACLYAEWHATLAAEIPPGTGEVLELGAGAGDMTVRVPGLRRSDLVALPGLDLALDAERLPFAAGSLRAVVMVNVFHHVARPAHFLREAERCLRPGGVVAAIEPWSTRWSRWVYLRLHHEPFDPDAGWEADGGPLSGGNGALPWIVLERDRERLAREAPRLAVRRIAPTMPFAYLLSGGVGLRALAPGALYPWVRSLERASGLERRAAMFARIVLERRAV